VRAAVDEVGIASTCMRANIKVEMRAGKAGQSESSHSGGVWKSSLRVEKTRTFEAALVTFLMKSTVV